MNNVAQIEINGVTYYVPADQLDYLVVVDNHLVNVGATTITLYHNFREIGNSSSGYPRVSASPLSMAVYQASYSSTATTLNVSAFEVQHRVTPTNTFLLIAIVVVLIFSWFKGR